MVKKKEVKDIIDKYEGKLKGRIEFDEYEPSENFSREYEIFREEALDKDVSVYEKVCKFSERILKINPDKKDEQLLRDSIKSVHLDITPESATSFAVLAGLFLILLGGLVAAISFFLGELLLFLPFVLVASGAFIIKPLSRLPVYFANRFRIEASNQMILCILYVVMYMRHTSNLEHAIKFMAEHIKGPLALDFKKVFWDIETEEYFSIKESLDNYLEKWKDYNLEFVEAFHLIEGSLYERTQARREKVLEKALEVMLEGTYERMLHYAHNLNSPLTMLNMFGVVLPILGLVILPLAGTIMSGVLKWWHIFVLYDIILPVIVLGFGYKILERRPSGYGESEFLKQNPIYKEYGKGIFGSAVFIAVIFVLIGISPLILHAIDPGFELEFLNQKFMDYKGDVGPFGLGSLLMSLFVPLGIALAIWLHYKAKTEKLVKIKNITADLEKEFSGAMFQLGNRVADGLPVEMAFGRVANSMQGTPAGGFFSKVDSNIRKLGMSVEDAIFDSQRGAVLEYPSPLIESSMKVLIQSSKKGPEATSKSMITFSDYVRRVKKINERLNDLLAEVIGSLKSQVSFLTPLIAGVVVSVSSMLVSIINQLGTQFSTLGTGEGLGAAGNLGAIANILRIEDAIPGFYFQLIIGLYVVILAVILTQLANGIERGVDKLNEGYMLSKTVIRSAGIYLIVTLIGVIVFNSIAGAINIAVAG
jgi:hypothetical protein